MAKSQFLRKLFANTAVAGVLATTVIFSPVDMSTLSTAIAQAQGEITVTGDDTVEYRTEKEFTATIPGAMTGSVRFYLDGIPQGSPMPLENGTAKLKVTPVSYGEHTITARYITQEDGREVHPYEDGEKSFNTPLPNKSIVVGTDYDTYTEGEFVDQYTNGLPTKTSIGTVNNPKIFESGDKFTVKGVMTVGRARKIYETGLNPVGNTIYIQTQEHTSGQFETVSLGQANGTTIYTKSGLTQAKWGQGTVPRVNNQYRGQHKTARWTSYSQSVGDTFKYALELKAPSDPGLYFVQYASWKDDNTHVLQRLDNTFYRINPERIPPRELPKKQTSLSVSADQATVTEGTSSTLTAKVSPENAVGSVQFKNNGENIDQPVTVTNGTATLPYELPLGENSITAVFTPTNSKDFSTAISQATTVTVVPVKLGANIRYTGPTRHKFGETLWMEATVTDEDGQPINGGDVEFILNGTPLRDPQPVVNGVAKYDKTFDQPGDDKEHTITLRYIPGTNSNYEEVTSERATFTVFKPATPTMTVTADKNAAGPKDDVTLTATLNRDDAAGTVQFKNNGENFGEPVTVTNGKAELTEKLPLGTNNITAEFTPADADKFTQATSTQGATVTVKVTPTVTYTGPKTHKFGTQMRMTAKVTDEDGNPVDGGKVEFILDGTPLPYPQDVKNGVVIYPKTFNKPGEDKEYEITLRYIPAANSNYNGITSQPDTFTVFKPVEPTLSVTANTSEAGPKDDVTITATLNREDAEGTIQFKNNGENFGEPVKVTNGKAELTEKLPLGTNNITAEFTPADADKFTQATSTQAATVTVKITPTVTYTGPKTHKFGTQMRMTAKVTDEDGNPVDGGKVEFILDGTPLPYPQDVKNGVVIYPKTFNKPGEDKEYEITLRYIPAANSNYNGITSQPDTFVVTKTAITQLTVEADKPEATIDDEITLTATVTPKDAKGTVQFKNNGENFGEPVKVTNGKAELTQRLPLGTNTITAEFTPEDPNLHSRAVTQTAATVKINPRFQVEAITTDVPFLAGLPGELTAQISDPTITGTVKFFDVTDGGEVPLGTLEAQQNGVPVQNGSATVTDVIFNETGVRTVKAIFTAQDGTTAELEQTFVVAQAGTGTLPDTGGAGIWSNTLVALAIIALGGAAALANRRRFA